MTPADEAAGPAAGPTWEELREQQRRQMEVWAEERRQRVRQLKDKEVFSIGEVALLVCVSSRTVRQWFDAGRLGGQRVGRSQRRQIPREELLRFLSEHGMPVPWEPDSWESEG
jgi:excisionase family DNA binding protein